MANAKKHEKNEDQHDFTTIVLVDTIPADYEGVKERLVSIATERETFIGLIATWYDQTCDKLIHARNDLEIRVDPKAFVDRMVSEKDNEIAKLRAQLEEAQKGTKSKVPGPDDRPIADADQEKFYETIRKMAVGFHPQKEVFAKLGWDRDLAGPVIRRLVARNLLEKETGVKGPAPKIKVRDKAQEYIKDPEQTSLPVA